MILPDSRGLSPAPAGGGRIAVLGCFDGMHLGHRSLAAAAVRLSGDLGLPSVAVSFDEPPAFSLRGGGFLLTDTRERALLFRECGLDDAVFLRFDEVRDMSADDFLSDVLEARLGVTAAVCGSDFTFGKNRCGTADTLLARYGSRAAVCPPVLYGGAPVSSSRIRACIAAGDVDTAAAMLGRPYSLTGTASRGRGDGTKLGFPTANLIPAAGRAVPAPGVYLTSVRLASDGSVYPAVTDAGFAPTLDRSGVYRLEAHLLGFSRPLYGETVTLSFLRRVRAEMTFDSPEALRAAIASDTRAAERYFADHPLT